MNPDITPSKETGWTGEHDQATSGSHSGKVELDKKSIHKKHTQA